MSETSFIPGSIRTPRPLSTSSGATRVDTRRRGEQQLILQMYSATVALDPVRRRGHRLHHRGEAARRDQPARSGGPRGDCPAPDPPPAARALRRLPGPPAADRRGAGPRCDCPAPPAPPGPPAADPPPAARARAATARPRRARRARRPRTRRPPRAPHRPARHTSDPIRVRTSRARRSWNRRAGRWLTELGVEWLSV